MTGTTHQVVFAMISVQIRPASDEYTNCGAASVWPRAKGLTDSENGSINTMFGYRRQSYYCVAYGTVRTSGSKRLTLTLIDKSLLFGSFKINYVELNTIGAITYGCCMLLEEYGAFDRVAAATLVSVHVDCG